MRLIDLLVRTFFFGALPQFFFGIGQGPSKEEKSMYNLLAGLGSYGASTGKTATNQALDYWSAILSGDPTKTAQVLAPEIKNIEGMSEQRKKQAAEFGTRSGGTAATQANIDTEKLASIQNLVNTIRPMAAGRVENIGANLLNLGLSGGGTAFNAAEVMQKQNAAKWNDIFKSIEQVMLGVAGAPGVGAGTAGYLASGAVGMGA